jgi:hypothetical protein
MKNLLFSLFAIGVAAVAAMTATTAMLNAPHRSVSPAIVSASQAQPEQVAPSSADTGPAAAEPAATPGGNADHGAKPVSGAAKDTAKGDKDDEEGDKDPYEGIAPEEIPPDMQYSADSSVSFPTNI